MDCTEEAFFGAAAAHAEHGTTTLLPTALAASPEETEEFLRVFESISGKIHDGADMPGVNLEGPYFNKEQKGAQNEKYIKDPDPDEYKGFLQRHKNIFAWCSAPELPGADEFASFLHANGIVASIGHTNAFYDDVVRAVRASYSHVVHLYSAMTGVTRVNAIRRTGTVESALLLDSLTVEVIADGIHLPLPIIALVHKIKGAGKTALVTDAMRAAGTDVDKSILGSYKNGMEVLVEGGVAKLPDRTALAGSVATTDRLVRNAASIDTVGLQDAICMMTSTPASIMKLSGGKGTLIPGADADIVLFDEKIAIKLTMKKGRILHEKIH
jgi:N-acetylglucosamine-6-phosphate deacetylase